MLFKEGMKVYCPSISNEIFTLELRKNFEHTKFPLKLKENIKLATFTVTGLYTESANLPGIFLATPKNQRVLQELYGLTFENPLMHFLEDLKAHFKTSNHPVVVRKVTGQLLFLTGFTEKKALVQGGLEDMFNLIPYSDSTLFLIVDGT